MKGVDRPTRHLRFVVFVHLPFSFRSHNQDVLELQQKSDVLTLAEATKISADELEVIQQLSRRRKMRFVEDYLYYD